MTDKNGMFSDSLITFLQGNANLYLHPEKAEKLLLLLKDTSENYPQTPVTESNLRRIFDNVLDKSFFLNGLLEFDYFRDVLFAISSHSNYLTDIVVRNPEFLSWVLELVPLHSAFSKEKLKSEISGITSRFKSFDAKVRRLKALKRREILRIGLRDLLGISTLQEITLELSGLAECISDELFRLCLKEIQIKYKLETDLPEYAFVALGKFGGNELNYSSDIDLILFFSENKELNEKTDTYGVYSDAIHLFINTASQPDESGFLYRVDFRLRPDGRTSPLCRTLQDYISYYESRGEYWERQMLIKSGFISGSRDLYQKFNSYLSHFVYPASFSHSPLTQIKKIRQNILEKYASEDNIKLSEGGIRDIEFGVQALQLINGGSKKEIRTGNTLEAISKLKKANLITPEESNILTESYVFYRKIEHYLQLMNDRQTHTLPKDTELLFRLSFFLGFRSPEEFIAEVDASRKRVRDIYNSIIGEPAEFVIANPLEGIKFNDLKKAERNYKFISEGKGLLGQKSFDTITLELFKETEPYLINFLKSSSSSDTVLENYVRVLKAGSIPSVWFGLFRNKGIYNSFLTCCELSQKFINALSVDTELREKYISGKLFEKISVEDVSSISLQQLAAILSLQLTLGILEWNDASAILASSCKSIIRETCNNIFDRTSTSFEYTVIILGSTANGQMNFNSDIDMIFITGDNNLPDDIQESFTRLLSQIRDKCKPFKVDCRLRPEGKSSPLVWTLGGYTKYLETRARIWEFQSLTKCAFGSGSEGLFNKFTDTVSSALSRWPAGQIVKEVINMRKAFLSASGKSLTSSGLKLKKGRGGIADIEFLIQLLILINPFYFKYLMGKNTGHSLSFLASNSLIAQEDSDFLSASDDQFRKTEIALQVIFDISTEAGKEKINSESLKKFPGLQAGDDYYNILKLKLNSNAEIIEKYFNRFLSE